MGGLFQLFWRRCRDIQELGRHPPFHLLWLTSELSWPWWACHLADTYNEAQGLRGLRSSAILGELVVSDQFMLCAQWLCQSFRGCALPLPLQEGTYFNICLIDGKIEASAG